LHDAALSSLFQATKEATEEAIIDSLLMATTTVGYRGAKFVALPIERTLEICRKHGVVGKDVVGK
jgi:D-aminopeptidase